MHLQVSLVLTFQVSFLDPFVLEGNLVLLIHDHLASTIMCCLALAVQLVSTQAWACLVVLVFELISADLVQQVFFIPLELLELMLKVEFEDR